MELSGRLISDSDNRVLMTPFIVGFFPSFFVSFQPCNDRTRSPLVQNPAAVGISPDSSRCFLSS